MIPSVLTHQLRQGVEDFLETTFPIATQHFHGLLGDLLTRPGEVFKGPYLSLGLPFEQGASGKDFFPDIPMPFNAHRHQEQAFQRLSASPPQSTIVATGTGSGKTECFLYPILDYCYQHRGEPGVKVILIYPMNALASDQAARIAKLVFNNPNLKGHVTAGLFIGQSEHDPCKVMGADHIITDKETQRRSPPDILLTNYKMLDYLLIRPRDRDLWQHNDADTLRYLVVDELHTFDGAQGTDLACLIRRLKARLGTPKNHLCCVGTSATLGDASGAKALLDYASEVFGETFQPGSIITEQRQKAGQFLENSLIRQVAIPSSGEVADIDPSSHPNHRAYVAKQHELWFGETIADFDDPAWRTALADRLRGHVFFQNLLKVLSGQALDYDDLLTELARITTELQSGDRAYRSHVLNSLLTLVSEAKNPNGQPFLQVRLQWWMRELRRMVATVADGTDDVKPQLRFHDDLTDEQQKRHLPIVHCRECGSVGWSGLKGKNSEKVETALRDFYIGFFNGDQRVTFLFPEGNNGEAATSAGYYSHLCPNCMTMNPAQRKGDCSNCGEDKLVTVLVPNNEARRNDRIISTHHCPYCGGHNSLTLVGSQAASLTSVLIAQLFASSFNDDKKLLTFSDSVQDAAHRAGFFAARTWKFNFRTALCQFIQHAGQGLTLKELPNAFIKHWSAQMDDKQFIATFIAPNMGWFADYDALQKSGKLPVGSRLKHEVERRIDWEVTSELAFSARIGRTLEKTLSATAHLNPDLLEQAIQALLEPLQNEIGALRELEADTLRRFLMGLVTHLRHQGAVSHTALETYIENQGREYLLKRIHWMPNFGPFTRAPTFLTSRKMGQRFDIPVAAQGHKRTWYQAWAERMLGQQNLLVSSEIDRFYDILLKGLVDAGILDQTVVQGIKVWGIKPEALLVSHELQEFLCEACGNTTTFDQAEAAAWDGTLCLRSNCQGVYRPVPPRRDYYGLLYASGDIKRIFAAEHTGLLKRDDREELERQFKAAEADRQPWHPNLLSCTPTLEMGIDIGDLSSAILCSVPPAQANYLQRIGRAGRRDGNALNVTIANGRPHDLYFFADPRSMLAGHVDPPGVFLNASAVLERQFTAFCFDRWVSSGIAESDFPRQLRSVLGNLDKVSPKKFPHNLMRFIDNHQTKLLATFMGLFTGSLDDESKAHITNFVQGDDDTHGSLTWRITHGLQDQRKQRDSLQRKVRLLKDRIKKKENDPAAGQHKAQELEELQRERSALQELVKAINDRDTLNFFTDEGLLPNYAFPEAGVVLQSIIYRRKRDPQDGGGNYDTWRYEYERSASSAIDELAPENTFYADGRKVKIDQVDMGSSEIETWRFCSNCSHSELVGTGQDAATCPSCGSTMWADAGQLRRMLRMRQVFATCSDKDSRIGDDSDDRTPSFYNKQTLVDFEDRHVTDAWRIADDDLPFGFEFLSRASFREINFGLRGMEGDKITIAGQELHRNGFKVCKFCGKVDPKEERDHTFTCTARDKASDKNIVECLYLYREFASEAIRMLLPVTTFSGSEDKLNSFVAALQLGLKRMFGGSVGHLQTAVQEEPVSDSAHRKRYLVLFDTVPGGTGYLKQLMRSPEPLMDVFALALDGLQGCGCNDDATKDGCYRCLFAYRNSYDMAETSRDTAVELLKEILEQRENLIKIDGLKSVSVNALFDSELEARFIEAIRRIKVEEQSAKLVKKMLPASGKPGYLLTVGEQRWEIEPQVNLGPQHGVTIPSKADFLFWPVGRSARAKPVAVFTDGYLYHRNRVGLDMAQRMAIVQSGNFHVWSLSWKDVENRFKGQGDYFQQLLAPKKAPLVGELNNLLNRYQVEGMHALHMGDSFDWLVRFLAKPDASKWTYCAFVHGLIHLDKTVAHGDWQQGLSDLPDNIGSFVAQNAEARVRGRWKSEKSQGQVDLWLAVDPMCINDGEATGMRLVANLPDSDAAREQEGFESIWNGFIRLYNLLQFLPHAFCVTSDGQSKRAYEKLEIKDAKVQPTGPGEPEAHGWSDDVLELADESLHGLLADLAKTGWPEPEVGYELADASGEIVGEAEVAWETERIAIVMDDESKGAFTQAQWKVFTADEVLGDPTLLGKVKEEG
ncbi:DEAD/DEAH box helicase domain protein [Magnetococcus marinus MC-1]|uniref:DEAD/DEAH box helicase domain protein n=1 Tax=Magnetococcus marinus (strain ATCC BAA-1437 / JCM 17883 / MC-1) TaxID=156889 RepID=A0L7C1_MAGMM|nr:DEAD/DEAH box helicase [Magnetococcus marinus]ABK43864.1 DEAD/DEAH box helicase domain protein [Magnetococcus marinus MC-1]